MMILYLSINMPKTSKAIQTLPVSTQKTLEKLGADLAVARLRRKESLQTWSTRFGVTVMTLRRLEAGDPTISVGIFATALWLINRDAGLGNLASPEHDFGALEMSVREAKELGRRRAAVAEEARIRATSIQGSPGSG